MPDYRGRLTGLVLVFIVWLSIHCLVQPLLYIFFEKKNACLSQSENKLSELQMQAKKIVILFVEIKMFVSGLQIC